jgi:hypothetical protein
MAVRLSSLPLNRPVINFVPAVITRLFNTFHIPLPRRRTVVSWGCLLLGMSTFVLMILGALPLNLFIGLFGFAGIMTGAVMLIIFCGEL